MFSNLRNDHVTVVPLYQQATASVVPLYWQVTGVTPPYRQVTVVTPPVSAGYCRSPPPRIGRLLSVGPSVPPTVSAGYCRSPTCDGLSFLASRALSEFERVHISPTPYAQL